MFDWDIDFPSYCDFQLPFMELFRSVYVLDYLHIYYRSMMCICN
jgi:hypothetical protein